MAKKNTLNELDQFLKSTTNQGQEQEKKEDFISQPPKQLVEVESVSTPSTSEKSDLQPEELMAKIRELAQREGISEERFLAKLMQKNSQNNPQNTFFSLPEMLVQGSFIAYNFAVMFKEYYDYFTQQTPENR